MVKWILALPNPFSINSHPTVSQPGTNRQRNRTFFYIYFVSRIYLFFHLLLVFILCKYYVYHQIYQYFLTNTTTLNCLSQLWIVVLPHFRKSPLSIKCGLIKCLSTEHILYCLFIIYKGLLIIRFNQSTNIDR